MLPKLLPRLKGLPVMLSAAVVISAFAPAGTPVNIQTNNTAAVTFTIRPLEETEETTMDDNAIAYAQDITRQLFEAVEKNNLIVAGKSEEQLSQEIEKLALEQFKVDQHWHKKIVRTGLNTLATYVDNPANRFIQHGDILFIDFGLIVNGYESDYARTFVLGKDPRKLKLKQDVEKAWYETREWILQQKKLTGAELFAYTRKKAQEYGWTSAGEIAGHIVGKYPHEQPANPKSMELDVHPDNPFDILLRDASGNKRHWILEMHFVDEEDGIGGYFEQLI
ncbi:MAG: M24 family metallopeptidase [Cyclobacteriaceae bacterium]|jgi:Xaa-Pro aminopeptidase|nr:M24 family metallopeptidase [Cyclobacteriaceae bacterium]